MSLVSDKLSNNNANPKTPLMHINVLTIGCQEIWDAYHAGRVEEYEKIFEFTDGEKLKYVLVLMVILVRI